MLEPLYTLQARYVTDKPLYVATALLHVARSTRLAHLSGLQQLVAQKEVRCDACARGNAVAQDAVGVKDTRLDGVHRFARVQIQADDVAIGALVLQGSERVLDVMAGVGGEDLGDDQESVGESRNAPLGLALDGLLHTLRRQVGGTGDLERTSTGDDASINDGVVHGTQSVTDRILDLSNGVAVGTLDENGDRLGILNLLNESELLLAKLVLVDQPSPSKSIGREVIHAVLCSTSANQLETLHVPSLGSPEGHDSVLHEDVETQGIDTLLVDDNEALVRVSAANLLLQLNDLLQLRVHEFTFALHQLVSLFRRRVVEPGVDLRLLVFQTDVQCQDEGILDSLRHIRVSGTMVQGKTADELGIRRRPVLHRHDLNHVQIRLRRGSMDGEDGIDDIGGKFLGESSVQFRAERRTSNGEQQLAVDRPLNLELVKELYSKTQFSMRSP